ncbi:LysR substrate-binding domain-containing protein [Pseudomonas sp. v388]|uniref:LysR substrate-binding domain-containing protein n=1 Tax=Pseudomonas sp. v388 TaxID=2479849 RepID=UPI0021147779|nr:LysR substrate-binding domain-containing protein [Pseudomonas sp. v388]
MSSSLEFIARVYPDIYLSVVHSSDPHPSLEMLRRESADILIVPAMPLGEHFVEHHRWSDHYVLAVAKSKRGAGRTLPELLQNTRYVAWRHTGLDRLHAQLAAAQVRLSHRGELSCIDTLLDLVAKGHCVTMVPATLLAGHHKDLESVPLPLGLLRQISVVARPASLLSSAANVVVQALRKPALKAVQGY